MEVGGVGYFRNPLWAWSIEAGILSWDWAWEGWESGMIGATRHNEACQKPSSLAFRIYLPTSITMGWPQKSHFPCRAIGLALPPKGNDSGAVVDELPSDKEDVVSCGTEDNVHSRETSLRS